MILALLARTSGMNNTIRKAAEEATGLTSIREVVRCKDGLVILADDPEENAMFLTCCLPWNKCPEALRTCTVGWSFPQDMQTTRDALVRIEAMAIRHRLLFGFGAAPVPDATSRGAACKRPS